MDNMGWIKLHRKLRDNPIYSNSKALHVWIECLLRASHHETNYFLQRQKLKLRPGQFCMGREEFGKSIGMSGSTAWFWIKQFEVDSMVDIKKSSKGSIVTIKRWNEYQEVDSIVDSKKTADEQQMNTNKNNKNDKNIYKPEIEKIYSFYKKKINSKSQLTDNAKNKIKTRLNGNTQEQLLRAIENFSKSNWWMENNAHRGVAWFFNSDDRIDQFLNLPISKSYKNYL